MVWEVIDPSGVATAIALLNEHGVTIELPSNKLCSDLLISGAVSFGEA